MIPTSEEILAKSDGSLRIASVNVNGVRAAYKRGMADWIAARDVDVLCLQEVRAPDAILRELIGDGWHILHAEASDKGRAGVAVLSRVEPVATRSHIGDEYFETTGRWVEADFALADGKILTVVSAYVHSGEVDTPKQVDKFRFLDRMIEHLPALKSEKDYVLVVGDLNVGHKTLDIKNWKGNVKRSGFLPEERAYFDRFFGDEIGYKDVARELAGEVDGPFTWWSWRGQAFVNDTGWRIDYHMATPE
ncbi:MAG: exodeoxyribonuclease III, partial [Paeniglutamicibacter terrestris]